MRVFAAIAGAGPLAQHDFQRLLEARMTLGPGQPGLVEPFKQQLALAPSDPFDGSLSLGPLTKRDRAAFESKVHHTAIPGPCPAQIACQQQVIGLGQHGGGIGPVAVEAALGLGQVKAGFGAVRGHRQ